MRRNREIIGEKATALPLLLCLGLSLATSYGSAEGAARSTNITGKQEVPLSFDLAGLTVEAKRPDWESKLSPGSVTVIRPDDYKGEQKTLPELLKEVPGVHVREVNGKGQYTTVTVRGSTASQVGVFIDGVLCNLGGDAAADISTIPVQNVERIEVYRGYIPSRFAGTFIGGVINVVTKRPTKTSVSAELGTATYGGRSGSLEMTGPLGSGSLLVGFNHEQSNGDFKYENYAGERAIPTEEKALTSVQNSIANFNVDMIDILNKGVISLTDTQIENYKANQDAWVAFVRNDSSTGLSGAIFDNALSSAKAKTMAVFQDTIIDMGYKQQYLDNGYTEKNWWKTAAEDWQTNGGETGIINNIEKNKIINKYVDNTTPAVVSEWQTKADPDKSEIMEGYKKNAAEYEAKIKKLKDAERWRKYNDYSKSSAIVKWQDKSWTIKGSWNRIDRHLPDSVWGGGPNDAIYNALTDVDDIYYAESRRQKMDNSELLVQKRQEVGKLEWGWMVDYLHQDKEYNTEKMYQPDNFRWHNVPLRAWSKYQSDKYNIQVDGTYKITDRQMLDFQANYSHERLNINGSLMDKVLGDDVIGNLLGQMRNRYDQDMLNIQVQDTITLDKKGSLWLTPSLRFNQSKITGYSDGKRFEVNQKSKYHWLHPEDSQTDGKVTWQLALKKEFNDHLTFRMTGGTYYRLLNMYEIAGDGAGILPASRDGSSSVFPRPEQGKQFDVSLLCKGKFLHADSNMTITYFWRSTEDMLQLVRAGLDYSSYFNDNKGKVNGVEFQAGMNWKKFALDLRSTYTKMDMQSQNSVWDAPYIPAWATYQPEWEHNVRLTYHPTSKFAVFGELHHTSEYFTDRIMDSRGGEYAYLAGKPVSELTVFNLGVKWNPSKVWQVNIGCNDVFDNGPKQKIYTSTAYYDPGYVNIEYPLQGRTFYATVRYAF